MLSTRNTRFASGLALALALGLAACAEGPSAPNAGRSGDFASTEGEPTTDPVVPIGTVKSIADVTSDASIWSRTVWACKVGTDATVSVSVDGGAASEQALVDGTCRAVHVNTGSEFEVDEVTVTELVAEGQVLDSMIVVTTRFGQITSVTKYTDSGTAVVITTRAGKGGIITYYNHLIPPPPPPGGGQGCTPGYWKQSQHFDSWVGYSPNQLFSSVFEDAFPGMTLLQVLGQGGGGIKALGRHTVAALLNTANAGVDYDMNTQGVIDAFNAAVPGGDYEALKNIFAGFNEQGCSLN